ncbi:hypothetical protein [Jannaschia formosa]|uniref:hypothetical protein n=1 Tax=Jannaschia formosa TaxID=2259592 RepID=UPI000E1BDEC2|nr:hypothetical protein [Jannaschia formosa]TFL20117.1 hypothetical protein DR046_01860 [Jannaschia formosa]
MSGARAFGVATLIGALVAALLAFVAPDLAAGLSRPIFALAIVVGTGLVFGIAGWLMARPFLGPDGMGLAPGLCGATALIFLIGATPWT